MAGKPKHKARGMTKGTSGSIAGSDLHIKDNVFGNRRRSIGAFIVYHIIFIWYISLLG